MVRPELCCFLLLDICVVPQPSSEWKNLFSITRPSSSNIFFLNVCVHAGGKKFCTTIDTLTIREPDSMLAAMFSGRHAMCQESKTVLLHSMLLELQSNYMI